MAEGAKVMGGARSSTSSSSSSSSFHFLAGLNSGILSAILLQPADLLKTRIQQSPRHTTLAATVRAIAAGPQPLRQFWRGTLPSTLRTGCGSAVYFSSLNALRERVARASVGRENGGGGAGAGHSSTLPKLGNGANLATGAAARTWAGFLMMPVTVLKVRFESSLYAYGSLWSASRDIFRTEGVRGFFVGFGATAVRDAPYAGLYVLFYELAKRRLSALAASVEDRGALAASGARELGGGTAVGINFVSGVLAAGLGTALTNPFDAIKTRMQLLPGEYGGMVAAARRMVREEGWRCLFGGLGLRMARKGLSSAVAWSVYEEVVRRGRGGEKV